MRYWTRVSPKISDPGRPKGARPPDGRPKGARPPECRIALRVCGAAASSIADSHSIGFSDDERERSNSERVEALKSGRVEEWTNERVNEWKREEVLNPSFRGYVIRSVTFFCLFINTRKIHMKLTHLFKIIVNNGWGWLGPCWAKLGEAERSWANLSEAERSWAKLRLCVHCCFLALFR